MTLEWKICWLISNQLFRPWGSKAEAQGGCCGAQQCRKNHALFVPLPCLVFLNGAIPGRNSRLGDAQECGGHAGGTVMLSHPRGIPSQVCFWSKLPKKGWKRTVQLGCNHKRCKLRFARSQPNHNPIQLGKNKNQLAQCFHPKELAFRYL